MLVVIDMNDMKCSSSDQYLRPRKKPTEADLRLYLLEVDNHCPICGKILQSRSQKKLTEKQFQIAHIYPNSPTQEQLVELHGVERLGQNSESYENKIALCKDCHSTQDYHTTREDYCRLLQIKKNLLQQEKLQESIKELSVEDGLIDIINKIGNLSYDDITELNYKAVRLCDKFQSSEAALLYKVKGFVDVYYYYIKDLFQGMEESRRFNFTALCSEIHTCFLKMDFDGASQSEIFNALVKWLKEKTGCSSSIWCEIIIAFFIQNCEVFNEITE